MAPSTIKLANTFLLGLSVAVILSCAADGPVIFVSPSQATLSPGQTAQFNLVVRGSSSRDIRWSLMRGSGVISELGVYKAPYRTPEAVSATVRGTLVVEPGKRIFADALVTLPAGTIAGADSCRGEEQDRLPEPETTGEADELPVLISVVAPVYPESARARGIEGTVELDALVCRSGAVFDTWVRTSIPLLDEAADAAVRQWVFRPAKTGGVPMAFWVPVGIRFTLAQATVSIERGPRSDSVRNMADPRKANRPGHAVRAR